MAEINIIFFLNDCLFDGRMDYFGDYRGQNDEEGVCYVLKLHC